MKTKAYRIARAVGLFGVVNFIVFVAGSFYLGGDAFNGYRKAGHYFLGMHSNGPFTEVSRSVFLFSEWHASVLIVTVAFVLVAHLLFRTKVLKSDAQP
jgi:hypothetical protein